MKLAVKISELWKLTSIQLQVVSAILGTLASFMQVGGDWKYGLVLVLVNVLTVFARAIKQEKLNKNERTV